MDLTKLKAHEDRVVTVLGTWPRIEQLIALNYLRAVLNLPWDLAFREIEKEYKRELKEE